MSYGTLNFEDELFNEQELDARFGMILDREPRIHPKYAQEHAVMYLRAKYDALSAGAGDDCK